MLNYPNYYLVTRDNKYYCRLPGWLGRTLKGEEVITYIIGPFVFFNGFDDTKEGKYLIKVFPYYPNKMTQQTQTKVTQILDTYKWWVRIHKEYVKATTIVQPQ